MLDLKKLNLTFVGYWDRCFFTNNNNESGLIVKDKDGKELYLTYNELKKMMEKLK